MCWQAAAAARAGRQGVPSGTRAADDGATPPAEETAPADELLADAAADHDELLAEVGPQR
ncbi:MULTISPECIES: hypothetical protein [Pseudonocardia]|uniref:Uncharacterized protein n=2 Tax=Pseudonocardia TaxID=1847 RepID=A0A1Y2MS17_PSEAH|nr:MULTISPECIES: hypothetical protein [Pseudonocardia]OSY37769.1 hypothetical protein BG845_04590 [Pseudonocardia autotrophica]TDN75741.1 hypothetical protein C8E95_4924 [Pseudonocardia autotrophica]BBF99711.1 hypothetical protein Pdca_09210 [Pseudonocardia autotrophica]GEC27198.1 hypothetical protein PSA01_42270 [Pseudonocardia saturnea]